MTKPKYPKLTQNRKQIIEALYEFCLKNNITIEDAHVNFIKEPATVSVTVGLTGVCVVLLPLIPPTEEIHPQYTWTNNKSLYRKYRKEPWKRTH